ncbi:D-alanyl-D-alanine carboxypeptidase family protein, partial [Vibrio parahaemolyticus VP2007-007]
VERHYAVQPQ